MKMSTGALRTSQGNFIMRFLRSQWLLSNHSLGCVSLALQVRFYRRKYTTCIATNSFRFLLFGDICCFRLRREA